MQWFNHATVVTCFFSNTIENWPIFWNWCHTLLRFEIIFVWFINKTYFIAIIIYWENIKAIILILNLMSHLYLRCWIVLIICWEYTVCQYNLKHYFDLLRGYVLIFLTFTIVYEVQLIQTIWGVHQTINTWNEKNGLQKFFHIKQIVL